MKQKLISAGLFFVMMIVVLHNAVPHHHHEEILMHHHDAHHDDKDAHSGDNHQPVSCLIQSINLSVPRTLNIIKSEIPADVPNLSGILVTSLHFPDAGVSLSYIPIPPGDPIADGAINDLIPRAPPC
jgi:hypothetical protein